MKSILMLIDGDNQVNRSGGRILDLRTSLSEPVVRAGGRNREKRGRVWPVPGIYYFTFRKIISSTYSASDSINANPISIANWIALAAPGFRAMPSTAAAMALPCANAQRLDPIAIAKAALMPIH